jgi:hypothetical protein
VTEEKGKPVLGVEKHRESCSNSCPSQSPRKKRDFLGETHLWAQGERGEHSCSMEKIRRMF